MDEMFRFKNRKLLEAFKKCVQPMRYLYGGRLSGEKAFHARRREL